MSTARQALMPALDASASVPKPLVKWTGGKTDELPLILPRLPPMRRYLDPFMGGGALFWAIPAKIPALCGDASLRLSALYRLQAQASPVFRAALGRICAAWAATTPEKLARIVRGWPGVSETQVTQAVMRAVGVRARWMNSEEQKSGYEPKRSAYYLFRSLSNAMGEKNADRSAPGFAEAEAALFWTVRELCYGGMFRQNSSGGTNVPYGGLSYDGRDMAAKFSRMDTPSHRARLEASEFLTGDFENVTSRARAGDFVFLDPPYDGVFSAYDGNGFGPADHERLARSLRDLPRGVAWMMVIAETPLVNELYVPLGERVEVFDKAYRTNIRNRNGRRTRYAFISHDG